MTITTNTDDTNNLVRVSISGRFDFSKHESFKKVLDYTKDKTYTRFIIDFTHVDEIDSSAIGMILLLRDMAGGDQCSVELINIRPTIKEELDIAQIYKLVKVA